MSPRHAFWAFASLVVAVAPGCKSKDEARGPTVEPNGNTVDIDGGKPDAEPDATPDVVEAAPEASACAPACGDGAACVADADCTSHHCDMGACVAASCTDTIQNGDEVGVDCGGSCATKCGAGAPCTAPGDCDSQVCTSSVCQAATCTDGVQNGTESDLDCGAGCDPKCAPSQKCGAAADCTTSTCDASGKCACPAGMAFVPNPGGHPYCIDSTEVTRAAYIGFINANYDVNQQRVECLPPSNSNFIPQGVSWPWDAADAQPANGVTWCDADAYCTWSGKHLCGAMGGGGNPVALKNDAASSEWYNACSANGNNSYPYGTSGDDMKCAGPNGMLGAVPTSTCVGGFVGIYDMSGSVAEWEDSCDPGTDECLVRGGSYAATSTTDMRCSTAAPFARTLYHSPDVGFRCCL